MRRILILNDTLDHSNWGSQACARALRRILREANPGSEIDIIPSAWIGRRYGFDPHLRGKRLFKNAGFPQNQLFREHQVLPRVADEFETVADLWQNDRGGTGAAEFARKLRGVDAIVFNAEGSTYRTNYTAMKSLFLLWLAKTRYGIPAFFLNGSVTLTEVESVLPGMVRKVFRAVDGVTVREPNSLRIAREWVPDVAIEMVPDSVFELPLPARDPSSRVQRWLKGAVGDAPYFCFSLSMLPSDLQRFRQSSATCELILELQKVVPNAVLMARDRKDQYLEAVAAETGSAFFGTAFGHEDAMDLLRDASFLCSGRYHHVIMATMTGCPAIPLMSTSPKMQGLCQLLGDVIHPPFDPTDLRPQIAEMLGIAREQLAAGEGLREKLRQTAAALRPQTARMGEMVRDVLEARADPQPGADGSI